MKLIRKRRPEHAGDGTEPVGMDRREFLRRSSLSVGAAAAAGLSPVMMRRAHAEDSVGNHPQPGTETQVRRSICTHCSVGCGVIAEIQNGVWTGTRPRLAHQPGGALRQGCGGA